MSVPTRPDEAGSVAAAGHHDSGGLLFLFDEARRAHLLEGIATDDRSFTETVSGPDWAPDRTAVALLSFDARTLNTGALATRGRRVATAKYSMKFSDFVSLHEVSIAEIERAMGAQVRHHFVRASQGNGGGARKSYPSCT